MKTLIALLAVVSVGVFFLYFRKNRFSKKKNDGTNQSYISFMQKLCDDEFVPTIGNAGYYELDIRVPLDISVLPSVSVCYEKIIAFLADECGLSEVVRYVKLQTLEDTYYYEFVGMRLNRLAVYFSADNVWSSDMEDMHDTLADIDINDAGNSAAFIASEEFEEAYKSVECDS